MSSIDRFYKNTKDSDQIPFITKGIVHNTNDPQQMGRIQVLIPSLGEDTIHSDMDNLPWASYVSPFGGIDEFSARGVAQQGQNLNTPYGSKSSGFTAYGFWNIPKIGSQVVVFCIDSDPNQLYYFGNIFPNSTPHTLPHGRYLSSKGGPLTSTEQPIQPLFQNTLKSFGDHTNYEWRSRGSDYSAASISPERMKPIENDNNENHTGIVSKVLDDRDTEIKEKDGQIVGKDLKYRQGYALSKSDPTKNTQDTHHIERDKNTDKNLESTTYCWTTPGFHAFSMDDRPENCRARLRTSSGHQIIMDDTNERIYISTMEGRNWVEMDADGHIYIFSEESISMRAKGDVNITADKTVRIKGNEGIHLQTPKEIRLHAVEDIHIIGEKDMFTTITGNQHNHIKTNIHTTVDQQLHVTVGSDSYYTFNSNVNTKISSDYMCTVSGVTNFHSGNTKIKSDGTINIDSAVTNIKSPNFNVDAGGNTKMSGATIAASIIAPGSSSIAGANINGGNVSATNFVASNGQDLAGLHNHTHKYIPGSGTPTDSDPFSSSGSQSPTVNINSTPNSWGGVDANNSISSNDAELAFWTNIVPDHEPWARVWIQNSENNINHVPQFTYDDPNVGRSMKKSGVEDDRLRNPLWHR